jgi:hypothetical protein
MQQRRGTQAEWNDSVIASTVILQAGELGLETDTGRFKIGNGVTVWQNLPYYLPDNNPSSVPARQGKNNQDIYSRLSPLAPTYTQNFTGAQVLVPQSGSQTPLVVSGIAGQSAVLQRWRDGNDVTLASIDQNGKITANGGAFFDDTVNVNNNKIINLAIPTEPKDAVTKEYVDEIAQGLSVKPAVQAATTENLDGVYDNGVDGVGSTLTLPASATFEIDGWDTWDELDGVLVKDQTDKFENGRYFVSQVGDATTEWILDRCPACDTPEEIPSAYVFVQHGDTYANTGWVAAVEDLATFEVGVDDITWVQFSGAGTFTAGDGLVLDGPEFNVVGTTDRITANADSIDIASTYAGQASITTLGNVTTGTWEATTIDETKGGTGQTSYAVGDVLYADSTTSLNKLSPGTATYALLSGGTGVAPAYGQIKTNAIEDDAVTYDKLQNISNQYRVLGRIASGSGNTQELTPDQLMETINQGTTDIAFSLLPVGTTSTTVAQGDHTHTLDQLSDVVISGTPAARQVIKYDGTQWINEVPSGGISVGSTPPNDASAGDAWFDSTDGSLYVYYDDGVGLGYQEEGSDTATVSHGNTYSTTLLVSWSHDEANSRYLVDYTYSLRAGSSFFFGQELLGQLSVNGSTVWSPSGNYAINANQTLILAQGQVPVLYPPSADFSMTWSGTVRTVDQGSGLLPQATVTVGPEVLVDVSPYSTATAQWVQVKANSALEASILTRLSAVEARTTKLEGANAIRVLSMAERDAAFPAPVQGNTVFRADLGYEQKYFEAYDPVNVPDGTNDTPGWYQVTAPGTVSQTDGTVTTASTSSGVVRNIYISTSDPSGGMDGDVWIKYTE